MNATDQGVFSAAPLELLFPDAAGPEIDRIRAAASSLDQARPATDPARWWWHVPHATFPEPDTAGTPVIISTSVNLDDSSGDWTELELDVSWTRTGMHEVTAQLGIACHCDTDHGTHYIHQSSTPADNSTTLASVFEDAVRTLIDWIAGPSDPNHGRAIAGLPSTTSSSQRDTATAADIKTRRYSSDPRPPTGSQTHRQTTPVETNRADSTGRQLASS